MDDRTKANWLKIKQTMEESGKTDNMFYRRAVSIITTGKDPLDSILNKNDS